MANIKAYLWRLYEGTITRHGKGELSSHPGVFSRGISVDEKSTRVNDMFKLWYEFTDPTNMTDILLFYHGCDPFIGFDWSDPIPNPYFIANYSYLNIWGIMAKGIHILNKSFPKN